jgi:hypothetical protein
MTLRVFRLWIRRARFVTRSISSGFPPAAAQPYTLRLLTRDQFVRAAVLRHQLCLAATKHRLSC